MLRSKGQRTIPISVKTSERLRRHMKLTGRSNLTRMVDSIINTHLDSPAAKQLEDVSSRNSQLSNENWKIKRELIDLKGPVPFVNPFAVKKEEKNPTV
jgi:hypothetical protein